MIFCVQFKGLFCNLIYLLKNNIAWRHFIVAFSDAVKKLNKYANSYGWECDINSWTKKDNDQQVWVIVLTKGPVCVHATGSSLVEAGDQMLKLLDITEKIAIRI